jgi:hypothetical protein
MGLFGRQTCCSKVFGLNPAEEINGTITRKMRIAIAGTHYSGKTTLAETLAKALKGYDLVEEPYHQLVDEGHEFSEIPDLADFSLQLDTCLSSIRESSPNSLFDRSPLDFLAYARCVDKGSLDEDDWIPRIEEALGHLDFLIFCPIEEPDRIKVPRSEDPRLRAGVHHELESLVTNDELRLLGEVQVLEVYGSTDERLKQCLAIVR